METEIAPVLAGHIVKTKYEDLPMEVVEKAKLCILDSVGCALGGCRTDIGKAVIDLTRYLAGKPKSTVFGSGVKTSSPYAAFANAAMSNALDFDDTYVGHPGATVVPSAIAVGESAYASGKSVIAATVVGYEVSLRIGMAIQPSWERLRQVWGLGTWQTFGAAAAAAKLLGLNEEDTLNALTVGGSNAPLSSVRKTFYSKYGVTMVKNNYGAASEAGIIAALLARRGFKGPRDIFEGDDGFWRMYGSDRCNLDRMTEKLGERYEIMNVSYKPYPSCRWTHSILDGIMQTASKNRVNPDDIDEIIIHSLTIVTEWPFNNIEPKTMVDGQFAVPYLVAIALTGKKVGPEWYTQEAFGDPRVMSLARKVKLVADPEADKSYPSKSMARVNIVSKGKSYSCIVEFPKGDPQNPMTREDLHAKFLGLSSGTIGRRKAERTAKTIDRLEDTKINTLTKILY